MESHRNYTICDTQSKEIHTIYDTESAAELKRFLGDVKETLEALDCSVHHWDCLIVFMIVRKLDSESLKDWEKTLSAMTTPPSFADLEVFLIGRVHTLEALERSMMSRKQPTTSSTQVRSQTNARSYAATTSKQQCALCTSGHYIASCPRYLEKILGLNNASLTSRGLF